MSAASDERQQRRTKRLRCSLPASWRCHPEDADQRAEAIEASAHGLFLAGVSGAMVGDTLHLVLELPGGALNVQATVRYVGARHGAAGVGLELAALPPAKRMRWLAHYRLLLAMVETASGGRDA